MSKAAWKRLRKSVVECERCPRLTEHCRHVAETRRRAYQDQRYWGRPVPNLGELPARLLVVGLAPGAHGANRTGRMFTGDRSGEWLYRAMFRAGFANQPESLRRRDGLRLQDAVVTNIGRCAPPQNKPTSAELLNCRPFFLETIRLVDPQVIVALGQLAWKSTIQSLIELEWLERPARQPKFGHGQSLEFTESRYLLGSYHPSQQNTFTGRLTESMLDDVFAAARKRIA